VKIQDNFTYPVPWVADNVDHNLATLDGWGYFHDMMGIVAVYQDHQLFLTVIKSNQNTKG